MRRTVPAIERRRRGPQTGQISSATGFVARPTNVTMLEGFGSVAPPVCIAQMQLRE